MKRIILITILQTMLFFKSAFAEGYTPPCRQGWPVQIGEGCNLTPAVVDDVDRDGDKEIIVVEDGQYEKNVYMFDKKGYVLSGWPVNISNNGMAFIKTPAVGNIDGTDNKEIITVCAEPELNNLWPIRHTLKITAIDADGRILDGWPFEMRDIIYVTDPVLTDMNNSGNMEIIFGTVSILSESQNHIQSGHELFWQIRVSIYVLHYNNNALRDYQIDNLVSIESVFSLEREIVSTRTADIISPIAVGDIIGDKVPEIIFSIQDEIAYALSYKDRNNDGMMDLLPGWPLEGGTPVLVDLDRDRVKEVILADYLRVYNGDATEMAGYNSYNDSYGGFGRVSFGPPAVGDVDNDGKIEIVAEGKVTGGYGGHGGAFPSILVYVLNCDGTLKTRLQGPYSYYTNQDILADLNNDGMQEIISCGVVYSIMQNSERINLDYTGRANVAAVSNMFEDGSLSLIVTTDSGYVYVYDFSSINIDNSITPRADWPVFRYDSRNSGASELTVSNRVIPPPIIKIKLYPDKQFYNAGEKIKVSIVVSSEAGIEKILVDNSCFIGSIRIKNKVNTIYTTGRKEFVYSQNIVLRKSETRVLKIQAYDILYSLIPNEAHYSSKQVQLTCRSGR